MSLTSDLNAIKTVQDGVKNNKVTRFAYTANAYANNDVDGHSDYVATRDNNIPLSDLSVIEVNQTVVDKGFRARASALNRMFLNHLFGRVSYNLNKINDLFNDLLVKVVANLGVPNGLATLDANGRIPYTQLPEDAMEYQGDWNAQTNTPTLADGTGTKGDTYNVSVGGTQDLGSGDIVFFAGDRVIYNGSVWQRASGGNVLTVSEIAPDEANGNVDLSKQTDVRKILSSGFLDKIYDLFSAKAWLKIDVSGIRVIASAEDNGTYYIIDSSRRLYTSTDRLNWTYIYSISDSFVSNYKVWLAVRNGMIVIVYTSGSSGNSYPLFSLVRPSENDNFTLTQIASNGSQSQTAWLRIEEGAILVVVNASGGTSGIWRSTDLGVSYTRVLTYSSYRPTYQNNLYHAQTGGFRYSNDGVTWEQCTLPSDVTNYNNYTSVVYANGIWLVGGQTGGYMPLWSEDGKTWYEGTGDTLVGSGILRLAFINNTWFAMELMESARSTTRIALKSTDGKIWTQCIAPAMNHTQSAESYRSINILYEKGVYLVNVNRGEVGLGIYYSYDGTNWYFANSPSSITNAVTAFWIAYGNGVFIAMTDSALYKSIDGITWEEVSTSYSVSCTTPTASDRNLMCNYKDDIWFNAIKSVWSPSGEKYINGEQE